MQHTTLILGANTSLQYATYSQIFCPRNLGFVEDSLYRQAATWLVMILSFMTDLAYPTIRSGVRDFSLKDQIPIEAAYAYIECKHTLTGKKQGPLEKGINQVREAKKLLLTREELPNRIYQNQYRGKHLDWPHHLPRLRNQPFGMLISRFVADDLDVSYLNSLEIGGDESTPDVVVLGSSLIMTPTVALEADGFKTSLFYDPADGIALRAERVPQLALALGLTTLLYALNYIELLPINWGSILNDAFWTGAS